MWKKVRPRRRRVPTTSKIGQQLGKGPIQEDAVSGWPFPIREMVMQRGRLVSAREKDGSLDRPQKSYP